MKQAKKKDHSAPLKMKERRFKKTRRNWIYGESRAANKVLRVRRGKVAMSVLVSQTTEERERGGEGPSDAKKTGTANGKKKDSVKGEGKREAADCSACGEKEWKKNRLRGRRHGVTAGKPGKIAESPSALAREGGKEIDETIIKLLRK